MNFAILRMSYDRFLVASVLGCAVNLEFFPVQLHLREGERKRDACAEENLLHRNRISKRHPVPLQQSSSKA